VVSTHPDLIFAMSGPLALSFKLATTTTLKAALIVARAEAAAARARQSDDQALIADCSFACSLRVTNVMGKELW
jgi:hypothetical protein